MSSLSYSNEHLAWQQRVNKEVGSFNFSVPQSRAPILPISMRFLQKMRKKHQSTSPNQKQPRPENLMKLPDLLKTVQNSSPYNKVVSRPSTQGSLVKSKKAEPTITKKKVVIDPIVEEEEERRPLQKEVGKIVHKAKNIKEVEIKPECNEDKDDGVKPEIEMENEEELDMVDDLPEANPSERSFKTTSSQLRYIQHLEEMLKDEKDKRNQLEKDVEVLKEVVGKIIHK